MSKSSVELGESALTSAMFCWELGPLHSTFVALPPPARASTRTQTAPQQAAWAVGLMRLRTAGVSKSEALEVEA